ncbi:hypothetical protein VTH06DRAFT_1017 [Thermothelomyces fergusii]
MPPPVLTEIVGIDGQREALFFFLDEEFPPTPARFTTDQWHDAALLRIQHAERDIEEAWKPALAPRVSQPTRSVRHGAWSPRNGAVTERPSAGGIGSTETLTTNTRWEPHSGIFENTEGGKRDERRATAVNKANRSPPVPQFTHQSSRGSL